MAAVVEKGVHLLLVAYVAHLQILVRDLKLHRALAVAFALPEPTHVHVARLGVDHLPLPVGLIVLPLTRVRVAVRVCHGAVPGFTAGHEAALVGVAGRGDQHARPMRPAVFLARRNVWTAKVQLTTMVLKV